MYDLSAKILSFLAVTAYVLLSMLPGGTMLCVGGGHDWSELIATQCNHGRHHHARHQQGCGHDEGDHHRGSDLMAGVPIPDERGFGAPSCLGCEHHHRGHDSPCTDIAAPDVDARVHQGERKLPALGTIATSLPLWVSLAHGPMVDTTTVHRITCSRDGPPSGVTRDIAASLRAVRLLI